MNGSRKQRNGSHFCTRCYSNPVFFRVRSEILNVDVCVECGLEAVSLGLMVTQLSERKSEFSPFEHMQL